MTQPLHPMVKAVHAAWGRGFKKLVMPMGPLEGDPLEYSEAILHELCHMATLGKFNPTYGKCHNLGLDLGAYISRLPLAVREQNEVDTISAEEIVLARLGIPIHRGTLVYLGSRNSNYTEEAFDAKSRHARRRVCVQRAVERVTAFVLERRPLVEVV